MKRGHSTAAAAEIDDLRRSLAELQEASVREWGGTAWGGDVALEVEGLLRRAAGWSLGR